MYFLFIQIISPSEKETFIAISKLKKIAFNPAREKVSGVCIIPSNIWHFKPIKRHLRKSYFSDTITKYPAWKIPRLMKVDAMLITL